MASANSHTTNAHNESDFGKGNDLGERIAYRRQNISSAGSTCMAAIAASVLIAWSVWNNRPTQPSAPVIQTVGQIATPSTPALDSPEQRIQTQERGEVDLVGASSDASK
jgi:hypothetical protein